MKISLELIKQFTKVKLGNEELLKRINSRLAEVENVENLADKYEGILVAQIKEAKVHPDADKLGIYKIFNGTDEIQVVAGDKTLKVGDKVAHIAPGLTVPASYYDDEPFVLEARKLRGVVSNGMLGSAKELDFGDEHDRVLKLDTPKPPGTTLIGAYQLDDVIIEVENKTLTHRPDTFGHLGFAREIAGIQGVCFTSPEWFLKVAKLPPHDNSLKLTVENKVPEVCPTYLAAAVSGVRIEQSPVWLMSQLSRIGLRPINNIVDTTNFYMIMTGQPLHAFDYDKLSGGKIIVRYPQKGEKITLLDGRKVEIHPKAVTICDASGPIALGGVMGGADSEVGPDTKNVVFESANFDMYSIRKTSMIHGIFSDAATRFMRGQSPVLPEKVLREVLSHKSNLGGGKIASDITGKSQTYKPKSVAARFDDINRLLGTNTPPEDQKRLLENVEIKTDGNRVKVPFWRKDLNIWQDVAEEVGRLSGYDNIKTTLPSRSIKAVNLDDFEHAKQQVRALLSNAGANEMVNHSGVSRKLTERLGLDVKSLYHVRNSLSPELEFMRASLLPGLMDKIHLNHKRGYGRMALFEIGKTHLKGAVGEDSLPLEFERLGFVFSVDGKTTTAKYGGASFYQAKAYLKYLLQSIGISQCDFESRKLPKKFYAGSLLEPKRSAVVKINGSVLGVIGEFGIRTKKELKLPEFSAGFEIDLQILNAEKKDLSDYQPLPRFPGTVHDITFRTPKEVDFIQVLRDFSANIESPQLITIVRPIDIYQKDSDSPTRNITLRLSISHRDKTMSSKEINQIVDKAVAASEQKLSLKRI